MSKSVPPVLFIIFNRPEKTSRVFERIRAASPARLYLAADGPRADRPDEAERCRATRAVVDLVDWPCEVHRLYRDQNLGCRIAVSQAISWFFENEPEGIVLEDDCLPDPTFFPFVTEMLDRYRDDKRVMLVSGFNQYPSAEADLASYFFSIYGSIWGWASWRRAWDYYDLSMRSWTDRECQEAVRSWLPGPGVWRRRSGIFDRQASGQIDTWDYAWTYARMIQSGLAIVPRTNLIQNIGFDAEATHTSRASDTTRLRGTVGLPPPYHHPRAIARNVSFDERLYPEPSESPPAPILRRLLRSTLLWLRKGNFRG